MSLARSLPPSLRKLSPRRRPPPPLLVRLPPSSKKTSLPGRGNRGGGQRSFLPQSLGPSDPASHLRPGLHAHHLLSAAGFHAQHILRAAIRYGGRDTHIHPRAARQLTSHLLCILRATYLLISHLRGGWVRAINLQQLTSHPAPCAGVHAEHLFWAEIQHGGRDADIHPGAARQLTSHPQPITFELSRSHACRHPCSIHVGG